MKFLHLKVDYNETAPAGSYAGMELASVDRSEVHSWREGDPVADWKAMIDWAEAEGRMIIVGSSLTHFLHDVPGWRMIEDERGREMLVPEDRPEWLAWEAEQASDDVAPE